MVWKVFLSFKLQNIVLAGTQENILMLLNGQKKKKK